MEITIKCGNSSAVIDSMGAQLTSLVIDGREIMWCADPEYWGKSSPVLFPAVGNVRNNKTVIDGKTINMPKHGFARDNNFSVIRMSATSVVFGYNYKGGAEGEYPYKCSLAITYAIYTDKLLVTYKVSNYSYETMYFCLGAHPAIACKNLDDCSVVFDRRETASTPVMNLETRMFESENRIPRLKNASILKLNYDMFDNDVVYFDEIKSTSVTFKEKNKTLARISYTGFNTLGLWTPAGKRAPFLCIEPWCGCDDYDSDSGIFSEKKDIQSAKNNETKTYTMTISAE